MFSLNSFRHVFFVFCRWFQDNTLSLFPTYSVGHWCFLLGGGGGMERKARQGNHDIHVTSYVLPKVWKEERKKKERKGAMQGEKSRRPARLVCLRHNPFFLPYLSAHLNIQRPIQPWSFHLIMCVLFLPSSFTHFLLASDGWVDGWTDESLFYVTCMPFRSIH